MAKRIRRRSVDAEVQREIEDQVLLQPPPTAAAIAKHLIRKFPDDDRVPSLRTVQEIVAEKSPAADPSAPWALSSAEPDEIALVMPVLAAVAAATEGKRQHLTRAEASALVKVRSAARDLPFFAAYQLARVYMSRQAHGETTADLDLFLSWGAWRNEETADGYFKAVNVGWVGAPPTFLANTAAGAVAKGVPRISYSGVVQSPGEEPEHPPAAPHRYSPTPEEMQMIKDGKGTPAVVTPVHLHPDGRITKRALAKSPKVKPGRGKK
jgi:hypothetical protein